MIKNSVILVIGAGQIGCAACIEILKRKPKILILHTLTAKESNEALDIVRCGCGEIETELIPSAGDVLTAYPGNDDDAVISEIKYRFDTLTHDIYRASPLWKLIEKFRPDMIVDGINTATVVGYSHDPYTTSRELKQILETDTIPDREGLKDLLRQNLLAEAIPQLVRFTQVLHLAMIEFDVKRYVKISTSGLGGMGFNIKYTHGDLGEPGCSPRLLGKVAATGVFNQLLWTLSHTPGLDIKIIIPTALVGWEDVTTNITLKSKTGAKEVQLIDCAQPLDLTKPDVFISHKPIELGESLKMAVIDSGENGYYGLGDMTTITTLGQMGCITKEEVGIAVAESLEGSTRYDICSALDSACLGPSFNAAFERSAVLGKLRELDRTLDTYSAASGNLGPTVTKHLWELEILRILCDNLTTVLNNNTESLADKAERLILSGNPKLRQQILSLRMPILLEGNRILLGAEWFIPKEDESQNIMENLEIWALEGWVDLRVKRMTYWQSEIAKVRDCYNDCLKSSEFRLMCNYQSISLDNTFDPGEVLGFIYTINGGSRKL
ncbi:hypothetical protein ISS30_04830 [bacterium]|nr:hypothetical protein [FCB group bacterium]MBL7190999.1 hypothetical protein [bacterium]